MTTYFDNTHASITGLRGQPRFYEGIRLVEEKLVFDCTVAAMMPGFPDDLRRNVHEVVLRHAVYMLPVNAPLRDFEYDGEHERLIELLCQDLHTVFHELASRGIDGFSDEPLIPLRCLYARGEEEREKMVPT